jgi:Fe-S-cluster-containing hydrogenase component 2
MKTLVLDIEKCSGCGHCELICAVKKQGKVDLSKSHIRLIKYERDGNYLVASCMQCRTPVCREVCPVKAIEENPTTGAMIVDEEKCIGCKLCSFACPFGGIVVDFDRHVATKCNLCDGDPECAKVCPRDCIKYMDYDKIGFELKKKGLEKLAKLESLIMG